MAPMGKKNVFFEENKEKKSTEEEGKVKEERYSKTYHIAVLKRLLLATKIYTESDY